MNESMNFTNALKRLQNDDLSSVYKRHYDRLEMLFAGEMLDVPFGLRGISVSTSNPDIDPVAWFASSIAQLADQMPDAMDDLIFRPMSVCYNPRGVHFIDDLFGADVFLHDFSEQWQARPICSAVGELKKPDVSKNAAWNKVMDIARLFVDCNPANVMLELPTLSSALNVAVNLYGGEILVAMISDPDSAHHDLRIINDLIIELHSWFIEHVPADRFQPIAMSGRFQPSGSGQLCGCTTQLLSNELYETFIAKLDAEVLSLYPRGGLIHLCGAHCHHIPTWHDMPEVKCVQLNDRAALDLPRYVEGLRSDQILYVDFFEDMPAEEVLAITCGERLVLVGGFDESVRSALKKRKYT